MSISKLLRLAAAAALAAVVMSWAAASANAARGMSVTNGVTLFVANGNVTITKPSFTFICRLTLGIAVNSSIAKAALAQIGAVQLSPASSISACNLGVTGTILNGITIGYLSFTGVLPNITAINARSNNFAILWQLPIIGSCLYTGAVPMVLNRNAATGAIDTIVINAPNALVSAGATCPRPASLTGTLTVLPVKPVFQLV